MTTRPNPQRRIVSRDEWLAERKELLADEKELARHRDRVSVQRRRLSIAKVEKDYVFDGPNGSESLTSLFDGRSQLIVYHFMFHPLWDEGCSGCTAYVDSLGDLSMLNSRDVTFVLISRSALPKLEAYKAQKGWSVPWFSSLGSDFNYDFQLPHAENVVENWGKPERESVKALNIIEGDEHGLSVFFRLGDEVFHTYSGYPRETESFTDPLSLLDVTPYSWPQDIEAT